MNALVPSINVQPVKEPVKESVHHLHANDFTQYPLLTLLDEARLLMQQECTLQYRLAAVLRELDARKHLDGKPVRLSRWLHHNFGLTFGAAREKVRTARALGELPLIDEAFRDGQLSYSKVRALTRAATPDNETELLERARSISAEGVEQLVRRVKLNECLEDAQAMIRSRALSTRWDETGMLIVQGKLTPEQGEVFLQALAKATEALSDSNADTDADKEKDKDTDTDKTGDTDEKDDTYWAKRADALACLMADSLSDKSTHSPGDRHQLMVHVAAETLAGHLPEKKAEDTAEQMAEDIAEKIADEIADETTEDTPEINGAEGQQRRRQKRSGRNVFPSGNPASPGVRRWDGHGD